MADTINLDASQKIVSVQGLDHYHGKVMAVVDGKIDTMASKKIDVSQKGTSGGVAELDENGKVLSSQLPSYVDDVLEYNNISEFPESGESGKIYVSIDTNLTYRWTGTGYTEISPSIALGETASTAYRGDRGKIAYDHAQNADIHVTADEKAEWNGKADKSEIPTTLPANGGNADTLGSIPASELERVRHAVIGGAGGNAQWTGIDATKGDTTIRMQVDADYDKILLFKSVDGQQTWTEIELNADTLDGKHASDFANSATIVHESIDNLSASGFYRVSDAAALIIHQFWDNNFSIQIKVDYRASDSVLQWRIKALGVWGSWQKLNDGGSAASVGGYTEAKIAALEARIAALEGGGT